MCPIPTETTALPTAVAGQDISETHVAVDLKSGAIATPVVTKDGSGNGVGSGSHPSMNQNGAGSDGVTQGLNPYAPRYADFLSNTSNFSIIESTLRGE